MKKINIEINKKSTLDIVESTEFCDEIYFSKYDLISLSSYNFILHYCDTENHYFSTIMKDIEKSPLNIMVKKINDNCYNFIAKMKPLKKEYNMIDFNINIYDEEFNYTINSKDTMLLFDNDKQCQTMIFDFMRFINMAVYYIHKPTTIISLENFREQKISHKRKNGKKISVTRYVYKTIHKISSVKNNTEKITTYNEREWNVTEWTRKGHYRTYRDKTTGEVIKTVWIEKTVCKPHGKIKDNPSYKITKFA